MKTVICKIRKTNEMNPKIDLAYCLENIQDTVQAVGISGGAKWTTWVKETELRVMRQNWDWTDQGGWSSQQSKGKVDNWPETELLRWTERAPD